jgi:hypothetical protein
MELTDGSIESDLGNVEVTLDPSVATVLLAVCWKCYVMYKIASLMKSYSVFHN